MSSVYRSQEISGSDRAAAFLLSIVLPGAGHVVQKRWAAALFYFAIGIPLYLAVPPVGFVFALLVGISTLLYKGRR